MLNNITSNTPGTQALVLLNENDITNDGKTERGLYNKLELDSLYTKLGNAREYTREVSIGDTLSSYTNWSHVVANEGYSIWKYPVATFTHNTNNQLYRSDKLLNYVGTASSESTPSAFSSVQTSDSKRSGATYTNNTTEAGTASGTPFNMASAEVVTNEEVSAIIGDIDLNYYNITNGTLTVVKQTFSASYSENVDYTMDYINGTLTILPTGSIASGTQLYVSYRTGNTIYIGNTSKFSNISLDMATTGVGNAINFAYSSGSNWATFTPTLDSTNSFSVNGNINWTASSLIGWTTATVNASASKYWIRIQVSIPGVIYPTCNRLVRADAAATDLVKMSRKDIEDYNYKWAYYNNNIYVTVPNDGPSANEGVTYIKSSSIDSKKRTYFITNQHLLNHYSPTSGTITLHSNLSVSGNLNVGGNFTVSGTITLSGSLSLNGNLSLRSTDYFYFGDESTDGSARISNSGGAFIFESRTGGSWQVVGVFST
jgi:hypothetical protein